MESAELDYFKKLLNQQKLSIMEESAATVKNGAFGVKGEELPDVVDRSSLETDRNFTLRLMEREGNLLKKINEALERIDQGRFGVCDECGGGISSERLKARPVATLCIACKEAQERVEKKG
ncbi:MAG: TraR/DksA C4-type zinc finger protein [Nitrospinae bacterium]|nr:TraR/DksA C4-type zinc finger protein [Nitrospinota bacterium]